MNLIPQFPLKLVVFQEEQVNLHIFEERYRQLITDCYKNDRAFGIPVVQKDKSLRIGTTVKVVKIENQYPDGRMDLITRGLQSFIIKSYTDPIENKLYAGAEVEFLNYTDDSDFELNKKIISLIQDLYKVMKVNQEVTEDYITFRIYQVVHKIGLTPNQEIFLLELSSEQERQKFVLEHLQHLIPIVSNLELMKRKISMNGHFKNAQI